MKTLPKITTRQQDILKSLYLYRFLTSTQIQLLMGHKNKTKTNIWLHDLMSKHYIEGRYDKTIANINKPAVYNTSLTGIAYLKQRSDTVPEVINRLYRDNKQSAYFIETKLLIADIAIELGKTIKNPHEIATQSHIQNPASRAHFLVDLDLLPDLIVIRQTSHGFRAHLVEVLKPNTMRYRIRSYLDLADSNDWEDHMAIQFPKVLFICPDDRLLVSAKRHVRRNAPEFPEPFDFMTAADVRHEGITPRLGP